MQESTTPAPSAAIQLNGIFPSSRTAVSLLFLANGLYLGSWTPKVPEIVNRLDLTPSLMGMMVVLFGVGSITIMPIAAALIARHGSTRIIRFAAIGFLPTMLLLTLAPNYFLASAACFLFGGFLGALDISMNVNAVEVERRMKRSIMSSCHGFWSLGALFGAAVGGYLIDTVGPLTHALIITAVAAVLIASAFPIMLIDDAHTSGNKPKARLPRAWLPWLIGFVALFSMLPEGAVFDWSALYLQRDLGASLTLASLAGASFSLTMCIMRFVGDMVRDKLGAVLTMRISTILAGIGMAVAGWAPDPLTAMIGFGICGIGISNMVPIAFSAAGNLPGMAQGLGLSVATTMGYSGALFAPTFIGFIAEHTGFGAVYASFPILFLVVLAFSHLVRHADGIRQSGH